MKHFHNNAMPARLVKSLSLCLLLLSVCLASGAQVYKTILNGVSEAPPNNSSGTGTATVTIAGTTMRLETSFSGLTGNTTVAHIHAPTAVAGSGTAGVATTTPSFSGFPAGVTSGSYDRTFDMTQASSYNAAYITANGGTTASAFAALKNAMNTGKSYLNIHSNVFPGGEIRGFFIACPTITVTIPDAFALPQGVLANTVYPAYAPASSITLEAMATGGTTPYTYNWTGGSVSSTATVSPVLPTAYSVTVFDNIGCTGTAVKTVNVLDISGGKKGDKINVCHKDKNSLNIDRTSVADHLAHGDMLGSCTESATADLFLKSTITDDAAGLSVKVYQNPSPNFFELKINSKTSQEIQVRVFDLRGRRVDTKQAIQPNSMLRLGAAYTPGTYIIEVVQGTEKQIIKLMKQ